MTVNEYLKLWLETYVRPCRAESTYKGYVYAMAHLSADVARADMREVSPMTLQRDVYALSAKAPRQAQILYALLHAAYRRAERLELVQRSPMMAVDMPRHQSKAPEWYTPAELARYVAAARESKAYPVLLMMAALGLRRSEALGVTWESIDGRQLHVVQQRLDGELRPLKSRASRRTIYLAPEVLRELGRRGRGYVCDISASALLREHRRTIARADLKRITLHGLRHSCASAALHCGGNLKLVQELLGHAHYSLTADLYAHCIDGDKQRVTGDIALAILPLGVQERMAI